MKGQSEYQHIEEVPAVVSLNTFLAFLDPWSCLIHMDVVL